MLKVGMSEVQQKFRPGPNQSSPPKPLIQNRHSELFFSYCYFSFRCFGLCNLFMCIASWAQTITFFLKSLIHIIYKIFFPPNQMHFQFDPLTEKCHGLLFYLHSEKVCPLNAAIQWLLIRSTHQR